MPIPRAGAKLVIGDLVLEVTQETQPCHLMDEAHFGLRAALKPDWRGGVCCRVVEGGTIRIGDRVDAA
jgi:MOSC domain-containing protein YiiM